MANFFFWVENGSKHFPLVRILILLLGVALSVHLALRPNEVDTQHILKTFMCDTIVWPKTRIVKCDTDQLNFCCVYCRQVEQSEDEGEPGKTAPWTENTSWGRKCHKGNKHRNHHNGTLILLPLVLQLLPLPSPSPPAPLPLPLPTPLSPALLHHQHHYHHYQHQHHYHQHHQHDYHYHHYPHHHHHNQYYQRQYHHYPTATTSATATATTTTTTTTTTTITTTTTTTTTTTITTTTTTITTTTTTTTKYYYYYNYY